MSRIKALLVLVILVGIFGSAFAKNFPGDRAGWKADYLYKKLNLTTEQYSIVYPAYFSFEQKVDDLKAKKLDKKALAVEMTKLEASVNADIEKTLTKDQITKWTPMKDKFYKMSYKKKVRKVKTEGTEEVKKDEKKDEKKDMKKDVKKDEKKDVKKDTKKEVKKEDKKEVKKDVKKEEPKKEEKKK